MISGLSSFASTIQSASAYTRVWHNEAPGQRAERDEAVTPERQDGVRTGKGRGEPLNTDDQRRVKEMKTTDRTVRAHEAAHMAAGGNLVTSGARYAYETGPDGQRYAVAGEVGIDTSKGRTPQETLARAQQIRAAALAPADPSGQDRAVAAAAAQMAADARAEIARANMEKTENNPADSPKTDGRAASFRQAIERSLHPAGQSVDTYA